MIWQSQTVYTIAIPWAKGDWQKALKPAIDHFPENRAVFAVGASRLGHIFGQRLVGSAFVSSQGQWQTYEQDMEIPSQTLHYE